MSVPGISYKWNYITFVLCLTYFIGYIFKFYPYCIMGEFFCFKDQIMIHGIGGVYLCVLLVTGIWVISTFWLLVINTGVQIFPWVHAFYSCGYVLRSEIVGSYDNFKFNYLENCHAIFCCGCSVLYFHQQSFGLIASLTMLVIYWLFVNNHVCWCEVVY